MSDIKRISETTQERRLPKKIEELKWNEKDQGVD